jgi:hypothetical protein
MNIDESILSKLTDEQKKKVEAAQTPEEFHAIMRESGQNLSQEQLEAISGGESGCWDCMSLPCNNFCPHLTN